MAKRRRTWGLALMIPLLLILAGLIHGMREARLEISAVPDVPPPAQDGALAALSSAGHVPLAPPVWAGPGSAWQATGDYRLFFAGTRSSPGAVPAELGSEIYAAEVHVNADGGVKVHRTLQLTDTPAGEETAPVLIPGWLAFTTRVEGRYQSLVFIRLDDPRQRVFFAFDRPEPEVVLDGPSAQDGARLAIRLARPAGWFVLTVDPASGSVEPADAGLHHIPVNRGEQAWLPNLVSRVRELPGVGPEKIAFLENVFFTVADQVNRWRYGAAAGPTTPSAAASEQTATTAPEVAGPGPTEPTPSVPAPGQAETAVPEVPAVQVSPWLSPLDRQPTAPAPTPAATDAAPSGPADADAWSSGAATTTAVPLPSPGPEREAGTRVGIPLAYGIRRLPSVRPDPQRPYAEVDIIEIDPSLLQIKMVPGTIEPRPTTGLIGSGVIPVEDWPNLVAAFNGGFAAMHGKFGMVVDRKMYLPPRTGIATLAVYDDGSIQMGTWGTGLTPTPDLASYRQNCPPLIENGTITAETGKLTLWGLSVANEVYLYRSGLGITADGRLIYAAGRHLSAYTLARALQMADVHYAMQLDVDEYHVAFITYDVKPTGNGRPPTVQGKKLRDDMRGFDGLFLRPFQLDFFYLVRRLQPLARAVRSMPGQPVAETTPEANLTPAVAVALPGRLAFASNRDGNWELYLMPAARPGAATRLTDHPGDDLDPAWSPDGRQLAFSSRRDGNAEIYLLTLADGSLRRLTWQPSEEWAPAWSPDGRRLAYQSDRHGQSDIYVTDLSGGDAKRLTPPDGNHEAPAWSPDGRQIVFDSDLDVGEAVHASINIYLMDADGSHVRRFYPYAESPAWSPDGRTIAVNVLRNGRWQIALLRTDEGGYRQVTQGAYDARYPTWSPDGRWLAFAGNETGHWELYAVPASGGQPIRLTFGAADNTHPTWGE